MQRRMRFDHQLTNHHLPTIWERPSSEKSDEERHASSGPISINQKPSERASHPLNGWVMITDSKLR